MQPIHLFDITYQHNQWLAARQSLIAGNIANANTPGYRAVDLKPFQEVLAQARLDMTATSPGHMRPTPAASAASTERRKASPWDVVHSGNTVGVEQELMKAGDVSSSYSLNATIIKAFHRMLLTSSRAA